MHPCSLSIVWPEDVPTLGAGGAVSQLRTHADKAAQVWAELFTALLENKNRAWKKLLLLQLILASPVPSPCVVSGRVFRPILSGCVAEHLQMSISIIRAKLSTEKFPSWLKKGLLSCLALARDSQRPAAMEGHSVQGPKLLCWGLLLDQDLSLLRCWQSGSELQWELQQTAAAPLDINLGHF